MFVNKNYSLVVHIAFSTMLPGYFYGLSLSGNFIR